MRNSGRPKKVALQLSMMDALEKPFKRYESIWEQLEQWAANLKMIRGQARYSELRSEDKTMLELALTHLIRRTYIKQGDIAKFTHKYRHDKVAEYTDKVADNSILGMEWCPTYDIMAEYLTNSKNRLNGLILANKDLINTEFDQLLSLSIKLTKAIST